MAKAIPRTCIACGQQFQGPYRRCYECRATDRTCIECGSTFHGANVRCSGCYRTERQCVTCGKPFRSRYRECRKCRAAKTARTPCQMPGCDNPKAPGQGVKLCQEHRDMAYQRKLASLRKRSPCEMPGCDDLKLEGRGRKYCGPHAAEGPQRERARIVRRRRERELGITHDQFLEMLAAQDGTCAICGNGNDGSRQLSVDHNHATGRVRGLLCDRCNPMLGYARDDIAVLKAAIKYLAKYRDLQAYNAL